MNYKVQDPQGQFHIIQGPEGATPDQVISKAQSLIPSNSFAQTREQIEPGIMGQTSPTGQRLLENAVVSGGGYGMGQLGGLGIKGITSGLGKITEMVNAVRNAPKALEDAMGSAGEAFGTSQTPSMIGGTARGGLESEQAANEALVQKLYGEVPKDIPVETPALTAKYKELSDEIPQTLANTVKKHIQGEVNPIRPNDIGTTNTKIFGTVMPEGIPVIPHQYTASPGTPSQLPPDNPLIGELIKLRSKLGAASRMGGIDGYNAGQLRGALEQDIQNLGKQQGPLGKMTNDVVNQSLGKATNYYREMMQQQGTPLYKRLATSKMEDIPDIIFKNGRTQDVLEAKAALGQEGFGAAKKSFFNDLIGAKDVGKVLAKYSQNNSDFLRTVFNPTEMMSLQSIANLQQKALSAAKTVERAKMFLTGAGVAAVGGGVAGKAIKLGMGDH